MTSTFSKALIRSVQCVGIDARDLEKQRPVVVGDAADFPFAYRIGSDWLHRGRALFRESILSSSKFDEIVNFKLSHGYEP